MNVQVPTQTCLKDDKQGDRLSIVPLESNGEFSEEVAKLVLELADEFLRISKKLLEATAKR